jgi:hypothetical protein
VQLISQKISALRATMPVIYREKRTSGPIIYFFKFRLNDVEYNRYSVFVVVSYHSLVSVGCIRCNNSVFFTCKFCGVIRLLEHVDLSLLHHYILFPLTNCHFHTSVFYNCFIHFLILLLFFHSCIFKVQTCVLGYYQLNSFLRQHSVIWTIFK